MNSDTRNMLAFGVIAVLLFLAYQRFVVAPVEQYQAQAKLEAKARGLPLSADGTVATPPPVLLTHDKALAQSPRVRIDTPSLAGSLALRGARVDDLLLKGYHEQVSKTSPLVQLLRPQGQAEAYFAEAGWVGANLTDLPGPQTLWTLAAGDTLSPGHPVVLTYATSSGLVFNRKVEVDAKSMFTLTDTVANHSALSATLAPYGAVQRIGLPVVSSAGAGGHQGAVGVLDLEKPILRQTSYKDWKKTKEITYPSKGGWLGITDKYWMAVFIPNQSERIDGKFREETVGADDVYAAEYLAPQRVVAPGAQTVEVTRLFAGAKTVPVLNAYKKDLGIPRFDDAVDWGWLGLLTKPIFSLLQFFYHYVGNFGIAILMLTVVIRALTFPLANRGFEMGVKMKKIQPEMQAMQKRLKDDPAAQQKEMMALYAREKVNPITGCLPMLLPIPVFIALNNLFTVTIDMYHAPFYGWIHDLSSRDPTTLLNLFGLIPWDPSLTPLIGGFLGTALHIGVWPLLYGFSMWLSTSMSPPTGVDPTQQMIFKFMPLMFTFILAQYAVGLLIYWSWSSLITIGQQYLMMRKHKVSNPIDDFFGRFSPKPAATG